MAVKEKNNTTYLDDNLTDFFSLPINLPIEEPKIADDIKKRIYALDIDKEEKANILNKVSIYNTITNVKEKNRLKKEIDEFLEMNE